MFHNGKLLQYLKACCDVWTEDNKPITKDGSSSSDSSKTRPVATEGKHPWEPQLQGQTTLSPLPLLRQHINTAAHSSAQGQELIVQGLWH